MACCAHQWMAASLVVHAAAYLLIGAVCAVRPWDAWDVLISGGTDELRHGGGVPRSVAAVATALFAALCFCAGLLCLASVPRGLLPRPLRVVAAGVGSLFSCGIGIALATVALQEDHFDHTAVTVAAAVWLLFMVLGSAGLMAEVFLAPELKKRSPAENPVQARAGAGDPAAVVPAGSINAERGGDGEPPWSEKAPLVANGTASNGGTPAVRDADEPQSGGWQRLLGFAGPERQWIFLGCAALLVRMPFSMAIPHFVSESIGAFGDGDESGARRQIVLLVLAGTVDSLLDFWNFFLFGYAQQRLIRRLRSDLFAQLLRQEVAFFDASPTGDLASRLQADTQEMASDLTWVFRWTIEALARIFGVCVYMFIREWRLALLTLGAIPICSVVNKLYGDWLNKNARQVQTALAEANDVAFEVLCAVRTVFSFNNQRQEHARYRKCVDEWYRLNVKQTFLQGVYFMVISTFLINTCLQAAILLYGGYLVIHHGMGTSVLIAFILYQAMLQQWVTSLLNSFSNLIKAAGAGEKVFQLLARKPRKTVRCDDDTLFTDSSGPPLPTPPAAPAGERGPGSVFFDAVFFGYSAERSALHGVTFAADPGQTVALVGQSGAGKSTCFHLLERFYEPDGGRITIDGVPIADIPARQLHARIALVGQEPVLFAGTVRSNILYSVLHEHTDLEAALASDDELRREYQERVERAAEQANAASFIRDLPQGYDTPVGERGMQLSGGQKQRVAIARALMQDPQILLLDEATSALDAESEHLVQQALDRAQAGRTTLVIAHRLSTVRRANRIVVFEKGRVVEQGTHEELLRQSRGTASYRALVNRQLCDGMDGPGSPTSE
eukprot:TRINITY_DN9332_c0_g1_i1.p1 TRINITY_DN9332_c0_g1~~TRINITY_DN9332_c0_g1_i1.p1  ORF type:complete len:869 (+),score=226.90 TRINITY_DN9332_c0_g1_i1:87-2609(+)